MNPHSYAYAYAYALRPTPYAYALRPPPYTLRLPTPLHPTPSPCGRLACHTFFSAEAQIGSE